MINPSTHGTAYPVKQVGWLHPKLTCTQPDMMVRDFSSRLRQEDYKIKRPDLHKKFQTSLGYIVKLDLKIIRLSKY